MVELQGFLPLVFSLLGFCPAACFLKSEAVESGSPVWGLITFLWMRLGAFSPHSVKNEGAG